MSEAEWNATFKAVYPRRLFLLHLEGANAVTAYWLTNNMGMIIT